MKMLINVPETVVADALRGMAAAHPELAVDVENRVIVRKDAPLAGDEGIQVAKVLVNDDVAVTDSLYTAGRRGTGATLFVEKIAGAAAEEGLPLERVEAIARQVNENARSFGVALSPCTAPAKGSPTFDLPPGELELGIGIHGEPGRERRAPMTSPGIAEAALDAILTDLV